jgi:hypothetical protein
MKGIALVSVVFGCGLSGSLGCGGARPTVMPVVAPPTASALSDEAFGPAVRDLLLTADNSRAQRLPGIVQKQLSHAERGFSQRSSERGLQAVFALHLLLRLGEKAEDFFGKDGVSALRSAAKEYARKGDEAGARAMYAALGLPNLGPDADAAEHVRAIDAYVRDLNAAEGIAVPAEHRARVAIANFLMVPTDEHRKLATSSTRAWVEAAIAVRTAYQNTRIPPSSAEQQEASRGLSQAPLMLVAVHLRAGDPKGARMALSKHPAGELLSPTVDAAVRRLESDPGFEDWLAMARLLTERAGPNQEGAEETENAVDQADIFRAAAFVCTVEAYRMAPDEPGAAIALATRLLQAGFTEVVPQVLLSAVGSARAKRFGGEPTEVALSIASAAMITELASEDSAAARRIFRAMRPLLDTPAKPGSTLSQSAARTFERGAEIELRDGNMVEAKKLLVEAKARRSTGSLDALLAKVAWQERNWPEAKTLLQSALTAPDALANPLLRAELHLNTADLNRQLGDVAKAQESLRLAYASANQAQALPAAASNEAPGYMEVRIALMHARIADHYGAKTIGSSYIGKALEKATRFPTMFSSVAAYAVSRGLLYGDLPLAREAFAKLLAADAELGDLIYPALWVRILERRSKANFDPNVERVLTQAEAAGNATWPSQIATAIKRGNGSLLANAKLPSERTEAKFYELALRDAPAGTEWNAVLSENGTELSEFSMARLLALRPTSMGPHPEAASR